VCCYVSPLLYNPPVMNLTKCTPQPTTTVINYTKYTQITALKKFYLLKLKDKINSNFSFTNSSLTIARSAPTSLSRTTVALPRPHNYFVFSCSPATHAATPGHRQNSTPGALHAGARRWSHARGLPGACGRGAWLGARGRGAPTLD